MSAIFEHRLSDLANSSRPARHFIVGHVLGALISPHHGPGTLYRTPLAFGPGNDIIVRFACLVRMLQDAISDLMSCKFRLFHSFALLCG